ncbi:4'-phosphopantetheinyl transferase superfamily protein [Candidatus Sumerlaeota bacterium]|nr:4'-phosphopantetheinyl transferase superfamily protein [Candidatus Sumerlaeota bacterium]
MVISGTETFLAGQEAHLWLARPSGPGSRRLMESRLAVLSPEERGRYDRFIPDRAKTEFLTGRLLLRNCLGRYLESPPESISFAISSHGKLSLEGAQGRSLQFNLSHTRDLVACVFAVDHVIGIDVEAIDAKCEIFAIAERFFSEAERSHLGRFNGPEAVEQFFRIWTLKEAYIKARGLGLSLPLQDFSFTFGDGNEGGGDRVGIGFRGELANRDRAENWQFECLRPTPRCMLAIAIGRGQRPDLTVICRDEEV